MYYIKFMNEKGFESNTPADHYSSFPVGENDQDVRVTVFNKTGTPHQHEKNYYVGNGVAALEGEEVFCSMFVMNFEGKTIEKRRAFPIEAR